MHTVLWRRLDREGHDACRYLLVRDRWVIEGSAVFEQGLAVASLVYRVVCDRQWASVEASVKGWVGDHNIDVVVQRAKDGSWDVNGRAVEALAGLNDIDLGFTPATNTNAVRRLCLTQGQEVQVTAVWLDPEDWAVKRLPQTYRRIREGAYEYRSPLHDFQTTLRFDKFGAVNEYPGLWIARHQ